ncbi:hypothetical protein HDG32_007087 [Paraburkholderia sp. CI2]|uniref:helix-turn-helix domain-containing protein n=1 Tax=Paraburkholderia sp. Clong3 TaxID=2991061 RepID=UPI0017FBC017|nr:hypothetical protein [Paraburkholderia sp. CI2]
MSMQRSRTMAVGQVRRARLILLPDEGDSRAAIMAELRCDSRFITTWQMRFTSERLAGLYGRHPARAPRPDLAGCGNPQSVAPPNSGEAARNLPMRRRGLWHSIVELLVMHEAEYLEHCRRYALERPLRT